MISSIHDGKPWPAPEDSALEAARKLLARGMHVVPLKHRHKEPARGWRNMRLSDKDLTKHFPPGEERGIGVVVGRYSGGLVDVNIDAPEVLELAPRFLPKTVTFGRASNPRSHWLIYADGAVMESFVDSGTRLVEIRSSGKTAEHTVFPPSFHEETGEQIVFDTADGVEPAHMTAEELRRSVRTMAAVALMRRNRKRIEAYEVIGALVRAGWNDERICELFTTLDGDDHKAKVEEAFARRDAKKPIAGWAATEARIGKVGTDSLIAWLDARQAQINGDFTARPVSEFLEDVPVDDVCVPHGYSLSPNETIEQRSVKDRHGEPTITQVQISRAPIIISGRMLNAGDNHIHLRLSWRALEGWRSLTCSRGVAMDSVKLAGLSVDGFPVGSDNSRDVQKYLRLFDAENQARVPTAHVTSVLGWHGENSFLWGYTHMSAEGFTSADLTTAEPRAWPKNALAFHAPDIGDRKTAQAYHASGTLDGWKEMVESLKGFPRVMVGIYTSFVAPLMKFITVPNFAIDWAGTTSVGKTTTLRAAASVWGRPGDPAREPEVPSILKPWNATRVGIERIAATVGYMPLFLDDTKTITGKAIADVGKVVYDLTMGVSRARGSTIGLADNKTYRTVLFSSGEASLVSLTPAGGTRARVLEVIGSPFDKADALDVVNATNAASSRNYGHAGPAFVQWLLGRDAAGRAALQDSYMDLCDQHQKGKGGAIARVAAYTAAIHLAAKLVHDLFGFEWDPTPCITQLQLDAETHASDAPPEIRAINHVASWCTAHESEFHFRAKADHHGGESPPGAGWAGWWKRGDWTHIDFIPNRLKDVLESAGFDPDAVLSAWKDNGTLQSPEAGHFSIKITYGSDRPRVIRLVREKWDATPAEDPPEDEEEPQQELPVQE